MTFEAKCHCGNTEIVANRVPEQITTCNCSICRRYGALWAYYKPEEVSIKFNEAESKFYIWGDREVKFHHCTTCGCLTHYITTEKCSERIFAINTRMSDPSLIAAIPVREVDSS